MVEHSIPALEVVLVFITIYLHIFFLLQADSKDRFKLNVLMTTCVNRGGGESVIFHLPGQMPRIKRSRRC